MVEISAPANSHPAIRMSGLRRLAIVVSMALVILAVVSSLFLVRTVDSQLADIGNTYEVRRQARDLILSVVDAETGQRGYIISRDAGYLDPYNRAIASMDGNYQKLLDLVPDNGPQRERLEGLKDELEAKRAEMARTIELVSAGNVTEATALVRSDTGEELMTTIRNVIGDFIDEEDTKLIARNRQVQGYRLWLVVTILGTLAAAAMLAYALFARAQRQVASLAEQRYALLAENETLEAHVAARTAEAEEARDRAERERARVEALLQDTNHRIGNSLATVSSLLGLQMARSKSDEVRQALEAAQGRVHAIASSHRRLRLGNDLETTDAAEFLEAVVADLATTVTAGRSITFETDIEPMVIPARDATTIGIVVAELVTNALKHAFAEGRPGKIWVRFGRNGGESARLAVEDDGQGISSDMALGSGLGAVIITQLAKQFGGAPDYRVRNGGGTAVVIDLPKLQVATN